MCAYNLNPLPGDTRDTAEVEVGERAERRGRKVQVRVRAAVAAVSDGHGDSPAFIYSGSSDYESVGLQDRDQAYN